MKNYYKDEHIAKRVKELVSKLSVEEKIGQLMQLTYVQTGREASLEWIEKRFAGSFLHVYGDNAKELQEAALKSGAKIPIIFGIDAVRGHAIHHGATIFPSQLGMSCSWNEDLIEKSGRVTAKEVAADNLHWTFSPILCIGRDLRWGRIDETFGEDPFLIGELGKAIIKGYQGEDLSKADSIAACAKHYIAYGESTGGRDAYDSQISIRKVREVFLEPFRKAVEAGCATFMTGYQSIDGVPATANKRILREILKNELDFNGFVVTDWNNTGNLIEMQRAAKDVFESSKITIEAGNDMIMNTPEFYEVAVEMVKSGEIPIEFIDEAVSRILGVKFALGLFDGRAEIELSSKSDIFACKDHMKVNLDITRESIVLLKNENSVLPINKKNIKKIAVIGPNADDARAMFGDWTYFTHPLPNEEIEADKHVVTPFDGIKEKAQYFGMEVTYSKGCEVMSESDEYIDVAIKNAKAADIIIAIIGDCKDQTGEFYDRADLNISGGQPRLISELKKCGKPLVVCMLSGKPLAVSKQVEESDAFIQLFSPGQMGGTALAEILFGEINPSGKLTISFPYHTGQLPVYYNQLSGWHSKKYFDQPDGPLFCFGEGFSYTKINYSALKVSKQVCTKDDVITISVDVSNLGDYDAKEVIQLYVDDKISSIVTPVKELKGFKKVFIGVGETRTVVFELKISELRIVNSNEEYIVESGEFTIMVGSNSRDEALLKTDVTVIEQE